MTTNLAVSIHAEVLKPLHSALLMQARVEAQDERARRQEERAYVDAFGSPWTPIDPKETIRDRLWNRIGAYLPPPAAGHYGNIYHKPGQDPLGEKGEEAIAKEGVGVVARCAGTKPDGSPCERIVGASWTYCHSHDESRATERSKAASKAARSKTDVEIRSIKLRLREVAEGVLDGSIDKGRDSVAFQGFGVLIRAIEVERRIKETEEIAQEVQALKAALGLSEARGA